MRLHGLLKEIEATNPFWSRKLRDAGINAADIRTLADLPRLPTTTKQDLAVDQAAHPPYGTNLTYPRARYCRMHQTSGTTGQPLRWLDTRADWDWFMACWSQIFRMVGLRSDDILAFLENVESLQGRWETDLQDVRTVRAVDERLQRVIGSHLSAQRAASEGLAVAAQPLPADIAALSRAVIVQCSPCGDMWIASA